MTTRTTMPGDWRRRLGAGLALALLATAAAGGGLHPDDGTVEDDDALSTLVREATSPGTAATAEDGAALRQRGLALAAAGDVPAARRAFDAALARDPRDAQALDFRGRLGLDRGGPEAALALADFDAAIALDPALAMAHSDRGEALIELGRPAEAVVALDRAIALGSTSFVRSYRRGRALAMVGRYKEARGDFDAALRATPGQHDALVGRAGACVHLGDVACAQADAQALLDVDPQDVDGLKLRGAVALVREDAVAAERDYLALERLLPASPFPHVALGAIRLSQDRTAEALEEWRQAAALGPRDPVPHGLMGDALADLHEWRAAIDEYDAALVLAPGNGARHAARARVAALLGDGPRAIVDFGRAIELGDDVPANLRRRGEALRLAGDFAAAVADFDRGGALKPGEAEWALQAGYTLAIAGRFAEAQSRFERAARIAPAADTDRLSGQMALDDGRYADALPFLQAAVDAKTTNEFVPLARYVARAHLGDAPAALREALAAMPVRAARSNIIERLIAFMLERIDAATLLAEASRESGADGRCDAWLFIAHDELLRGGIEPARAALAQSARECPPQSWSNAEAKALAARLDVAPQAELPRTPLPPRRDGATPATTSVATTSATDDPAAASLHDMQELVDRADKRARAGDIAGALADIDAAEGVGASHLGCALARSRAHVLVHEFDAALVEARRAIELAPKSGDAHAQLAATRAARGELDDALGEAQRAVALDAKSAEALRTRARLLAHRGEFEAALADLTQARRLDPGENDGYFVGALLFALHRWAAAADAFAEVPPNAAASFEARVWRATALAAAGQDDASRTLLAQPLVSPDGGIYENAVMAFLRGEAPAASLPAAIEAEAAGNARYRATLACEAGFLVGDWQLRHGEAAAGRAALERVRHDCGRDFVRRVDMPEFDAAVGLLDATAPPAARPTP